MSNNLNDGELTDIYSQRFGERDTQRQILWATLTKYFFQSYIKNNDSVLDLAAGYCEFINNVTCGKKYAVDLNPDTKKRAAKDVEVYLAASDKLPAQLTNKMDVVFVSNFFEHLDNKHQLLDTLKSIHKTLKKDGKVMILQPNIRLAKEKYWDFVDHSLPLTEKSLVEALELSGFTVTELRTRFLPYTTSSGKPINSFLIRVYLKLRIAQWLLGQQTFVVATPTKK